MKVFEKTNRIFLLTLIGCLLFNLTPAASGFTTYEHRDRKNVPRHNLLIDKVHKPSWKIAYRYGAECKPEDRDEGKILEEAITVALNAWLQPLRDMKPARPITNVFHYHRQRDLKGDIWVDGEGVFAVDLRVTFRCEQDFSFASISQVSPDIFIYLGAKLTPALLSHLTHELGHAFGLVDTYVVGNIYGYMSSGGLARTIGRQPSSVMAVRPTRVISTDGEILTGIDEDDKRGIIWLYKVYYEGLETDNCFFPDYMFEQNPRGCRPKHPLIFEIKHSHPLYALQLLDDDPTIDVNAQDVSGMTALHHAAALARKEVVQRLLAHKDIKTSLKNKDGQSALDIARAEKLTDIIALLQAVTPQQVVEDINGDGTVNILDLVVVASNFGQTGKSRADVNGDGVVDIRDLVTVASALQ